MGSSDLEVFVDQESNLSATKETVLLLGLFVTPDWFFFWSRNYGWCCSVLKRSQHQVLQNSALIVRVKPPITLVGEYSCGSNGGYDLHPQEHPIFGKVLRLDYFQSFDDGILDLVWIDRGFLGNTSSCTSASIWLAVWYSLSPRCPWGRPFLMTYSGTERRSLLVRPLSLCKKCPLVK